MEALILAGDPEAAPETLDALVDARAEELVRYQNADLARRYRLLVAEAAARETALAGAPGRLARAVAGELVPAAGLQGRV